MNVRDRAAPVGWGLGRALEPIYLLALHHRNRRFDRGDRVTTLPVPVISVGNLSVGGTGKTPMVRRVVRWLQEMGAKPAIAMRGYRSEPEEQSDEQHEHTSSLVGVPIVAQPDRLAGLRPLLDAGSINAVVLDDGFQHRRIARDLDLVLIDASRSIFDDRCLPGGWLREPIESLRRAGAIVLTHVDAIDRDALDGQIAALRDRIGAEPTALVRHEWSELRTPGGPMPLDALRGLEAVVALGIGHPSEFLRLARACGVEIVREVIRRDHHHWSARDARQLRAVPDGGVILSSEKDWASLSRVLPADAPLWRPQVQLAFESGEQNLRGLVARAWTVRDDRPVEADTISAHG